MPNMMVNLVPANHGVNQQSIGANQPNDVNAGNMPPQPAHGHPIANQVPVLPTTNAAGDPASQAQVQGPCPPGATPF